MRASFKQKSSCPNKQNRTDLAHYSFSKNIKSQIIDKATRKGNNFVDRVNGYIQMISPHNHLTRKGSRQHKSIAVSNKTKKLNKTERQQQQLSRDKLCEKLKAERQMNRNLQKCIMEIQKILWERNDRLEQLEEQLRDQQKLKAKNNFEEEEESSSQSCARIKQAEKQLKKHVRTCGVRQILSKMQEQSQNQQESSHPNITEASESFQDSCSYIKIKRPRTESQSEAGGSRRKR